MTKHARVGYMGIPLSNSEHMAMIFSEKHGLKNIELVPLMSANNVVKALVSGDIVYGVLATLNRFAGTVVETRIALRDRYDIEKIDSDWTPIHHCVFTKDKDVKVTRVVSHIQALLQSEKNLKELYPDAEWMECEDTAYAAEMLAKGELPEGSAAVCRKEAGEYYGLHLVAENVEDNEGNMTLFSFVRMRSADP